MNKIPLTKKQEDLYCFVAGYIDDNGYAPTGQEIAERLGTTSQMVDQHLKNIAAKGWIKFNGKRYRKIELVPKN